MKSTFARQLISRFSLKAHGGYETLRLYEYGATTPSDMQRVGMKMYYIVYN